MADFALKGTLSLDSKQFRTSTKSAAKETSKFSDSASKDFENLGKAGKLAFAGLVAASAVWLKSAVDLAVIAEETVSKFNTVTGASAAFADELLDQANAFGTTRSEMQGLIADLAAVGQGFGFTEEESVKLGVETVKLAGDLSSFNNIAGGAAEVSEILKSAYAGEREQLKRLGIVITQADVDQQALNETNKDAAKDLTAADKAAATYTLVVQRAGKAVGDLNRTSESTANQQRAVAAAFREVQEEAGQKLIPVLNTILEIGTDALPLFADVMIEIAELITDFVEGLVVVGGAIGDLPEPLLLAATAAGALKVALLALSAHPVIAGLALVAAGIAWIGSRSAAHQADIDTFTEKVVELGGAIEEATVAEFFGPDDVAELAEAGVTIEELTDAVNGGGDAFENIKDKIRDANNFALSGARITDQLTGKMDTLREGVEAGTDSLEDQAFAANVDAAELRTAARAAGIAAGNNNDLALATSLAEQAQTALTSALNEFIDQQRAAIDPVFAQIKATQGLAEAQAALVAADTEFGAGSEEAAAAVITVVEAQLDLDAANTAIIESGESALNTVRDVGDRADLTGVQMQGLTGDVRDAEEAAQDFAGDYQADFDADTTAAQRAVAEWQAQAAEEVVATVKAVINVTAFSAGNVRGFATGTLSAPAGLAVVGERGRELVDFGAGGQRVFPNDQTERILNSFGGSSTVFNVPVSVDARGATNPKATERAVIRGLSSALRKFDAGQKRPS